MCVYGVVSVCFTAFSHCSNLKATFSPSSFEASQPFSF